MSPSVPHNPTRSVVTSTWSGDMGGSGTSRKCALFGLPGRTQMAFIKAAPSCKRQAASLQLIACCLPLAAAFRLLLRHAVQRAEPPDQIAAMDADDLAVRKNSGEQVERHAIVRIVEGGDEHDAI